MKPKAQKGPRPKHVPQRTCVVCRTTGAKRGLVRIVRLADGRVEVDETGKKSGRGAYLCKTESCWEKALNGRALEYALKTPITLEDKEALKSYYLSGSGRWESGVGAEQTTDSRLPTPDSR